MLVAVCAVTGQPLPREAVVRLEASLHAGPGPSHAVSGSIPAGAAVRIVEECDLWRRVEAGQNGGWVHAALLKGR